MTQSATDNDVRILQRRAEQAIRAAKPREYIVRLLEQLVATAAADSDAARFAHRHLAELRLEESPWSSALHLRRVLGQDPDDDVAHALMGLCQALQANFRCAVSSYRRAVSLSPSNPWYNHNLGHLLDVALGAPREALPYLRRAFKLEPSQDEVAASLAHCLGRIGQRDEALEIARSLVRRNPREDHHQTLLKWLEQGAPAARDATVPGLLSAISPAAAAARPTPPPEEAGIDSELLRSVEKVLGETFERDHRASADADRARSIARDYARAAAPLMGRPAVLAAAIDYVLARVEGRTIKQKDVAERYGVSVSSLQARASAIRTTLRIQPNDTRYVRSARRNREDERN